MRPPQKEFQNSITACITVPIRTGGIPERKVGKAGTQKFSENKKWQVLCHRCQSPRGPWPDAYDHQLYVPMKLRVWNNLPLVKFCQVQAARSRKTMRPATSSFFVNKLVFTSTPASTSGTGYSASTSGSSLTRGLYRTKCCRGGSRRHGVNEFFRSRRRFLAVNPSSATPSSTRWRGQAGGPHQLVVTMENLAGPSVERNGGSFQ